VWSERQEEGKKDEGEKEREERSTERRTKMSQEGQGRWEKDGVTEKRTGRRGEGRR